LATVDREARLHVLVGSPGPDLPAPAGSLKIELSSREPEEIIPRLLEYAAGLRVSDLYFNTNEDDVEVSARHLGMLRTLTTLPAELGRRCVTYIKTMADMNISERRRPMDGHWLFGRNTGHRLDLRVNTIPTLHGEDCTVRILDRQHRLLGLDQLGFDSQMYRYLLSYLHSPSGLLLVTGPTETGKSTTLYACLNYLNNGERRIHTIEDPIEYSIRGIRQSQVNAKIGLGFDELLRNVLRQAPDVILIGEIRDAETGLTAVRAAGSGHMVLSTLHGPVGPVAIHTLLRLDILPHMLSNALLGVVSQRLLRTLCPHCKVAYEVPSARIFDDVRPLLEPGEGEHLYGPKGCPECRMTGYSSRTGIFEMVRITPDLRTLIDERASAQRLREKAIEEGMVDFRRSALLKVAQGETSIEEVVRVLPAEYLV
jgi:type II secretory ATPase GspE/PulE/Tfp pilus assembly ATPase PilB-like protein